MGGGGKGGGRVVLFNHFLFGPSSCFSLASGLELLRTRVVRETGHTVYRPYSRRVESLTICRCQSKSSLHFCWEFEKHTPVEISVVGSMQGQSFSRVHYESLAHKLKTSGSNSPLPMTGRRGC